MNHFLYTVEAANRLDFCIKLQYNGSVSASVDPEQEVTSFYSQVTVEQKEPTGETQMGFQLMESSPEFYWHLFPCRYGSSLAPGHQRVKDLPSN